MLQGLTTIPRDPTTNAPLTTIESRFKILDGNALRDVQNLFESHKRKLALAKTTKADKQRYLRTQGILPPKKTSKNIYGGGGEKTYDVGVVARAKERAASASLHSQERFLTEEEEQEILLLQDTLAANEKKLKNVRKKINRMTNGKTTLATSKKRAGGGSTTSSRASLSSTTSAALSTSTKSRGSSSSTMGSTLGSTLGSTTRSGVSRGNENGGDEDDDMFAGLQQSGGDEQLPDNILAMVNDAQKWTDENQQKKKGKKNRGGEGGGGEEGERPSGAILDNAKVEVFCALGTYMGRKRTNFVKDGVIQTYQPGKIIKRDVRRSAERRRGKGGQQEYARNEEGVEYYTVLYKDNDIEYDVKRGRINVIESRSEVEQRMYRAEKAAKLHKASTFHPPKVNDIPASVLDTTL